jgi:hypothetical protein
MRDITAPDDIASFWIGAAKVHCERARTVPLGHPIDSHEIHGLDASNHSGKMHHAGA